jgi:hypothetical protein
MYIYCQLFHTNELSKQMWGTHSGGGGQVPLKSLASFAVIIKIHYTNSSGFYSLKYYSVYDHNFPCLHTDKHVSLSVLILQTNLALIAVGALNLPSA